MFDNEGEVEIQESLLRKSDAEDGSDQSDHGDQIGESYLSRKRITGLIMGGVFFFVFLILFNNVSDNPKYDKVNETLAVLLLMVIWWLFEVIDVAATSLLPLILFPILGILNSKIVASKYMSDLATLFIAAFCLSASMKAVNLHKRFALATLKVFGTKPIGILCGFGIPAFLLSLFMSNTGTTALLIPIADGVIDSTQGSIQSDRLKNIVRHFSKGLTLVIGYSATIGGSGTIIATAPNTVITEFVKLDYDYTITFGEWSGAFIGMGILMLGLNILVIYRRYVKKEMAEVNFNMQVVNDEYERLGKMAKDEYYVAICFAIAMVNVVIVAQVVTPLYGECVDCNEKKMMQLFNSTDCAKQASSDSCSAALGKWKNWIATGSFFLIGAMPLFIIPSKSRPGKAVLEWKKAIEEIPWDLILLIGGGIAVAEAFKVTNTSDYIAGFLSPLAGLPPFFAVLVIVGSVSFLTEITSNTATTTILVPILFELANQNKKHPLLYGLPVCLGANLAFMLPIATGPNAVMYGTKKFKGFFGFAATGFIINICGIACSTLAMFTTCNAIFGLTKNYADIPDQWKR
eukprot:g15385.t1